MAGSIIIRRGVSVALNSLWFDRLASVLREKLNDFDRDKIEEIFDPWEKGRMPFIGFETLDEASFMHLYEAIKDMALDKNLNNQYSSSAFQELIEKIRNDPRFRE